MTDYYVDAALGNDKNDGSSGRPFKTPNQATAVVRPGDTVLLRGDMNESATWFREPLTIKTADTIWVNDQGHTPTFHGGYEPTLEDKNSYRLHGNPGGEFREMVGISAANVTLRGVRVQHVGGEGIGVNPGGHNARVTGCDVYMTYGNGLIVGGEPKKTRVGGVLVEGCDIGYTSQGAYAVGAGTSVGCAMILRDCEDVVVRGCTVHHTLKEGINVGRGGLRTRVEGCTVHTTNHVAIYINRTVDAAIVGNLVYHTKEKDYLGKSYEKNSAPVAIRIGDEDGPGMKGHWNSSGQVVEGNVVIGGGRCFQVSNNLKQFQTLLKEARIANNTFIGERWTDDDGISQTVEVIQISRNVLGKEQHVDSVIENNVFYAPAGVALGSVDGVAGVAFRNNAWYCADGTGGRPEAARGAGDVTSNPMLANPEGGSYEIDNYRPVAGSPLIGADVDGLTIGALAPWDEPEPPEPDYSALVAMLEGHKEVLAVAGLAISHALMDVDEMLALIDAGGGES